MTAQVERAEVDGVRVFSGTAPGRAYGALLFRVGHADESLPRRGITHLLEHLALHPQDRRLADFNGFVDITTTGFHCQADSLEAVGEFLTATARTLAELPFDRMEKEAQVLRAEAAQRGSSVVGTALMLRYGPSAVGAVDYEELFLHQPTEHLVRAHAARYFTRQNAVVVLSGSVPSTLDLSSLPVGQRMPVPVSLPVAQRYPAWGTARGNAVALTYLLPREPAVPTTNYVLCTALRHLLRETLAISYDVSVHFSALSSTHGHHVLRADCQPADAQEVAARIQTELSRIIYEGCSAEVLAEYQDEHRRQESQPGSDLGAAHYLAGEWLLGDEAADLDALRAATNAVTVQDVQRVARAIHEGALWLVPNSAPVTDQRVHEVAQWSSFVVHGTRYNRIKPDEHNYLLVGPDGISLAVPERGYVSVSFTAVAACKQWADGARTLFGADGFTLSIHPDDWVDGAAAVASIDRNVRPEVVVASSDPFSS